MGKTFRRILIRCEGEDQKWGEQLSLSPLSNGGDGEGSELK